MSEIKLPNSIKMVITDFDGVVTDNCVYINEDFTMSRKLNFKDVMGFSILRKNGFDIAIISGEKNSAIEIMAKKFNIKESLRKIYTELGYDKTPKASDLEEYFEIKDCLISNTVTRKMEHGFKIIKLKD